MMYFKIEMTKVKEKQVENLSFSLKLNEKKIEELEQKLEGKQY